jgi:hypothetical protein
MKPPSIPLTEVSSYSPELFPEIEACRSAMLASCPYGSKKAHPSLALWIGVVVCACLNVKATPRVL